MWIKVCEKPISTYGKHGKEFLLNLKYQEYYGHCITLNNEVVVGIWDSINECFFESKTKKKISNEDIVEWWKNI